MERLRMGKKAKRSGRPPGPQAAHRDVANALRKRLHANEWKQGEPLPSIRQLAKEYDVGAQVIRLALNVLKKEDRIGLNPRRQAIAKNQGFIATATSSMVALVLGHNLQQQWASAETAAIQRGIECAVGDRCDPLLLVHDPKRLRSVVPPDLLDLPLSGILLCGHFTPDVLQQYARMDVSVVLVDQPGEGNGLSSVSVDNEEAAFNATMRLIENGHRRLAFVRFVLYSVRDIDPDSKERERGFRRACKAAKIGAKNYAVCNTFPGEKGESRALKDLLDTTPRFTGIVAVDESRAAMIAAGAKERGLTIPRDLSVLCFQSAESAGQWTGPCTDFERIGWESVQALGRGDGKPYHLRVPTAWHAGRTLGPAPK